MQVKTGFGESSKLFLLSPVTTGLLVFKGTEKLRREMVIGQVKNITKFSVLIKHQLFFSSKISPQIVACLWLI